MKLKQGLRDEIKQIFDKENRGYFLNTKPLVILIVCYKLIRKNIINRSKCILISRNRSTRNIGKTLKLKNSKKK